jgi:hypothetical protein
MIYELRNKIPQNSNYIYSEDVLTSTIFGSLRYFSSNQILESFLTYAVKLDKTRLNLIFHSDLAVFFWKKISGTDGQINEPDLILEDGENVVITECKYHSLLSEENLYNNIEYTNQLIRYASIFNGYYKNKKRKIIIYLTYERKPPIDTLRITTEKISNNIELYWLSWFSLYEALLKVNVKELNKGENALYGDLLSFLRKRELITFNGFNTHHKKLVWKYDNAKHYSFDRKVHLINNKWRYL